MAIVIKRGRSAEVPFEKVLGAPFQRRVFEWFAEDFGVLTAKSKRQCALRFIEEAIELAQSCGIGEHEVNAKAHKVYSKPHDSMFSEVGTVIISLAGLCEANGLDMLAIGEAKLSENYRRIDQIRLTQRSKPV